MSHFTSGHVEVKSNENVPAAIYHIFRNLIALLQLIPLGVSKIISCTAKNFEKFQSFNELITGSALISWFQNFQNQIDIDKT